MEWIKKHWIIIVVVLILAVGIWYLTKSKTPTPQGTTISVTEDYTPPPTILDSQGNVISNG